MEIIFFVFVYNDDDDDAAIFNKLSNFTKFFKIIMSFFMSHSCCTQYDDAYCYNSKKIIQKNHYDRTNLDHKFDTIQFFRQKIAHPVHF